MKTAEERARELLIPLRRELLFCSTLTPGDFARATKVIQEAERDAYARAAARMEELLEPVIRESLARGLGEVADAIRGLGEE